MPIPTADPGDGLTRPSLLQSFEHPPGNGPGVFSDDRQEATMPNPKGSHLFVNVGPSEARRRLKGFGHGVRKIQSAGRNQAVINEGRETVTNP